MHLPIRMSLQSILQLLSLKELTLAWAGGGGGGGGGEQSAGLSCANRHNILFPHACRPTFAASACMILALASPIVNATPPAPGSIDGEEEGEGEAAAAAAAFTGALVHMPIKVPESSSTPSESRSRAWGAYAAASLSAQRRLMLSRNTTRLPVEAAL
jgi:hypothetical protein